MAKRPLTPKQQRFVAEYLVDLNATQAAIRAGYSAKTADVQGPRLLGKVGVGGAIAAGQKKTGHRTELTVENICRQIACLSTSDVRDLYDENGQVKPPHQWPDHVAAAISSCESTTTLNAEGKPQTTYKIRLWNKGQALEQAAKRLGLWIERHLHEHTGRDGGPIEVGLSLEGAAILRQALDGLSVPEPATPKTNGAAAGNGHAG